MLLNDPDCYPRDYSWGLWTPPVNPRGWFVPVTQMYDATGTPRRYAAAMAQCAALIAKGDKWWAGEFAQLVGDLNHGFQISPFFAVTGIWDSFLNLYNAAHAAGFIGGGHYWDILWTLWYDHTQPEPWRLVQSRVQAPNTSRLAVGGPTYPYNAAPWTNDIVATPAILMSDSSVFGDIWDNPI